MNTNDSQFLKAYNELVTAFFHFMNVVNPQGNQQSNLSYVASQLNQLLNYLAAAPQKESSITPTQPDGDVKTDSQPIAPPKDPILIDPLPPAPPINTATYQSKYGSYPEPFNGRFKFKSSMINDNSSEDSVYKLFLNEQAQEGYVELCPLSGDILKIVTSNPSLYLPLEICTNAGSVTPDKKSVTSKSRIRLVKVVRGWEIAEGEKFVLEVN